MVAIKGVGGPSNVVTINLNSNPLDTVRYWTPERMRNAKPMPFGGLGGDEQGTVTEADSNYTSCRPSGPGSGQYDDIIQKLEDVLTQLSEVLEQLKGGGSDRCSRGGQGGGDGGSIEDRLGTALDDLSDVLDGLKGNGSGGSNGSGNSSLIEKLEQTHALLTEILDALKEKNTGGAEQQLDTINTELADIRDELVGDSDSSDEDGLVQLLEQVIDLLGEIKDLLGGDQQTAMPVNSAPPSAYEAPYHPLPQGDQYYSYGPRPAVPDGHYTPEGYYVAPLSGTQPVYTGDGVGTSLAAYRR